MGRIRGVISTSAAEGVRPLSADNIRQTAQLDSAVKILLKLIKMISLYPAGHPALQGTLDETLSGLQALLGSSGNLACQVRRDHLLLEGTGSKASGPAAQKLAAFFFSRRVQRLVLQAGLSNSDLQGFARVLAMDAADLGEQGGVADALHKLQVSGIVVHEMEAPRLATTDDGGRSSQGESEKEPAVKTEEVRSGAEQFEPSEVVLLTGDGDVPADSSAAEDGLLGGGGGAAEEDLLQLLAEVEGERTDERYRFLLQELVPRLRRSLTAQNTPLLVRALMVLGAGAAGRGASPVRRAASREALQELKSPEFLDLLIGDLGRHRDAEYRKNLSRLLTFFGQDAAQRLVERLVKEEESATRKYLSEAVTQQGSMAVPVLIPYLIDNRWYVVRNAVAMLGEIRDQNSAQHLAALLKHDDLRVRREAMRALTRIGGDQAVNILVKIAISTDNDMCRQAILSLGALRHRAALPTLLDMVRRPDPFQLRREITREAVWALGEIGDTAAVPDLIALLQKRGFWKGRGFAEIRAAAALALGEVGAEGAAEVLRRAVQDRHAIVSRAAVQALRRIKKEEDYGSTRTNKDASGLVRSA
jgi:HEAT repeat protein